MGGSANASFTLSTSASVASTNFIGSDGTTLSGTPVVLKVFRDFTYRSVERCDLA